MTMTTFKVPEDLSFKVTLIAEARAAQAQSLKSKKALHIKTSSPVCVRAPMVKKYCR
jgi:hypothetical protein